MNVDLIGRAVTSSISFVVQKGDILCELDGIDVTDKNPAAMSHLCVGYAGSQVRPFFFFNFLLSSILDTCLVPLITNVVKSRGTAHSSVSVRAVDSGEYLLKHMEFCWKKDTRANLASIHVKANK